MPSDPTRSTNQPASAAEAAATRVLLDELWATVAVLQDLRAVIEASLPPDTPRSPPTRAGDSPDLT